MTDIEETIKSLKSYALYIFLLVLPLFFLPFTQEFFSTNKLYFLSFIGLFLLSLTTIEIIITKTLRFPNNPLELLKLFFVLAIVVNESKKRPIKERK